MRSNPTDLCLSHNFFEFNNGALLHIFVHTAKNWSWFSFLYHNPILPVKQTYSLRFNHFGIMLPGFLVGTFSFCILYLSALFDSTPLSLSLGFSYLIVFMLMFDSLEEGERRGKKKKKEENTIFFPFKIQWVKLR